ncbi:MAG TPA: glycoside hydrolase family 2 protein [Saprospiraceae bacterium]|nr:glycoside hydrolase family 2 protein [Saprospiraceae bacterium]
MKALIKLSCRIILLLLMVLPLYSQIATVEYIKEWELSKAGKDEWIPVQTPITVHTALFKANQIPDPKTGNVEDSLQWIGETDWKFRSSFIVRKEDISDYQYELVFEGLDTYAEVTINGKPLLKANNMYRAWHKEIKKFILVGVNKIEIRFTSPSNYIKNTVKNKDINYPGGNKVLTRKAPYQFGWDWAPTYITMGIWKPVYIKKWKMARIADMKLAYHLKENQAEIQFYGKFIIDKPEDYDLILTIGTDGFIRNLSMERDTEWLTYKFDMLDIERWWPNGMGEHAIYVATLKLIYKGQVLDKLEKVIGFRTIELITEKDSIGESMYFKVNGKPMYAKGANYVPPSSFPDQVKSRKLLQLIKDAQDCNFNMLRVWGGGYYESDEFYTLCDYAGILVWQDFMFACAMYPGYPDFIENVLEETTENVKRIGGHPCMALWCGNNEISEGWARWGWKDGLNNTQKEYLDKSYNTIFKDILSKVVGLSNQCINYWESSPSWGRGDKRYKTEGDAHDWWVWHDAKPFEQYEENVPRFMSEFGFQSYPEIKTIQTFAGKDVQLNNKNLKAHQKHTRGDELIQTYMDREYPKPKDFESFVYLSQRLQAEGIGRGIIAQRMAMPKCMGSLYWQYNDCWPAISWSSIDYYGRWKALQYKVKHLYAPIITAIKLKDEKAEYHVVSDNSEFRDLQFNAQVFTLKGELLTSKTRVLSIEPNTSVLHQTIDLKEYITKYGKENLCIYSYLRDSIGIVVSEDFKYLRPYKDLNLSTNALKVNVIKEQYGYAIKLTASAIVPGIWISSSLEGKYSDNAFDMLPGERVIKFFTDVKDSSKVEFSVRTLRDAWE